MLKSSLKIVQLGTVPLQQHAFGITASGVVQSISATFFRAGLAGLAAGQALALSRVGGSTHPWQTTPGFSTELGWFALVEPGFVNEECPTVRTNIEEQAQTERDFGKNPLTGKGYFTADVFSQPAHVVNRKIIDVPLYLAPAIALSFRAIGFDGPAGSAVPLYFKDRGAADAPKEADPLAEDAGFSAVNETPRGLRLLRVCDLILHQPRLALTSTITIAPTAATRLAGSPFAPVAMRSSRMALPRSFGS